MKKALFRLGFCLILTLVLTLPCHAAQVYLPDTSEVGAAQTEDPVITYYDEDGSLNTDAIPKPVQTERDILKPTLISMGIALGGFVILRVIRARQKG